MLITAVHMFIWHWTDFNAAGRIISLAWHPSGSQLAAGMMDMIKTFDIETGERRCLIWHEDVPLVPRWEKFPPHLSWLQAEQHTDSWWKEPSEQPRAKGLWSGPSSSCLITQLSAATLQGRSRFGMDWRERWSEPTWWPSGTSWRCLSHRSESHRLISPTFFLTALVMQASLTKKCFGIGWTGREQHDCWDVGGNSRPVSVPVAHCGPAGPGVGQDQDLQEPLARRQSSGPHRHGCCFWRSVFPAWSSPLGLDILTIVRIKKTVGMIINCKIGLLHSPEDGCQSFFKPQLPCFFCRKQVWTHSWLCDPCWRRWRRTRRSLRCAK